MKTQSNTIQIEDITKRFEDHLVLDNLNLSIKKNETISIIGPSGCGKTTLLRTIAKLEKPDSGTLHVFGKVGMVFQHCYLWPHKTVLRNVVEPLEKIKKQNKQDARVKAEELLKKFNLIHKKHDFPATLSGGEIQRTAIARSLSMNPEILLLDEITSSLDPLLVNDVLAILERLSKEKRTVVIVTHNLGFARQVSDRILFMDSGKIVENGHPYKIFSNPEHEKTRNFVNAIKNSR